MIELTCRLTKCRTRTRFNILRYNFQAGSHTIEVVRASDDQTFQWSANPKHPDSLLGWNRFLAAYNAAKEKLPPLPAGSKRTDLYLDLITSPASNRAWENFWWTPCSKSEPVKPESVDQISDLFGN